MRYILFFLAFFVWAQTITDGSSAVSVDEDECEAMTKYM